MSKQNNLSLIKSHIAEYLTYLNPSLKIKGTNLFTCLAKDTLINLTSGESKQIKDLQIGDKIYGIKKIKYRKYITATKVLNVINQGKKDIWHVKIGNKIIKTTPDHYFLAKIKNKKGSHWKQIQDIIKDGDFVYDTHMPSITNKFNYVLGMFCGFFDGDGYFNKFHIVFYISQKIECKFIEWVLKYLKITYNKTIDITKKTSFLNASTGPSYTYKLHKETNHFYRLGYQIKITNDHNFDYGYIIGLLLSDGSVDRRTSMLRFSIAQKYEIPYLEEILNKYNIKHYKYKIADGFVYIICHCHDIILYAPHSKKIKIFKKEEHLTITPFVSKNLPEVIKKEKNVTVYDIQTDLENFIANGIIVHNCPFSHNHKDKTEKPSCKIYPQYDYKATCFNSSCGELGNIFNIFRKCEPDMAHLDDNEIADYLIHLLDIKENVEVDKLLEQYYNSGFHLIPLCANDPSKSKEENAKLQKSPIQGESWKKNTCHDLRKWKEWVESGLGLGLVGGKISNVIILDIDTKTIPEDIKDKLPDTLIQDTKQGMHFIFEYDTDFDNVNHCNFRGKGYKMEVRANNAYIVVAPTIVEGYTRTWNDKKICKMSNELKKFILDLVDKNSQNEEKTDSDKEILEAIDNEDLGIKNGLKGLDGECNDAWIKMGGVLRKKMSISQVEWALLTFNKLLEHPQQKKAIKAMTYQLAKYDTFDKKDLAKEILEHLQLESVRLANTLDLTKSLGYERKDIEHALDYLVKEQKVVRIGKHFKALNKIEWVEDFMDRGELLNFQIPYFENYARFRSGALLVIGAKSGRGKTTLSCNIVKQLVEQGIKPYYVSTESGSNFDLTCASLGLKEGDFKLPPKNKYIDAFSLELEDNAITIVDWLKVPDSDYAKTDTMYERLNMQLTKHGGLLIAFAQLKNEDSLYAEEMTKHYASLVTIYHWGKKFNEKTKEMIYDCENTYFQTLKIRDSKVGLQYLKIPTYFNKETKRITLRTGE